MGKISLEGMEFFAYHGFYDEEQKIGNKYAVDVEVETDLSRAGKKDALAETVNYEELYKLIAKVMGKPARLLEAISYKIIEDIFAAFAAAHVVEVSISKFNPPIGGVCHRARVSIKKSRQEYEALEAER
ncbi:dihydroneopterin aldolase [Nafulsella turpanensis]|uniref:dihydroneopterin aldolase n=1 Tax=Nafulsella turpanensis TaxID=1265690 RepID=UPI000346FE26|nr:dihydroneopterin aldolase [Nafulsella turpanensis]